MKKNLAKDILFGLVVGDALGVPVEFKTRQTIQQNPVTGMRGFGTHNLPPGTFSDDSSLAFCLAEALTNKFSLHTIAENHSKWLNKNFWTANGNVFDVGIATSEAIHRFDKGISPELAGGCNEQDNGNGSLMRILPLILYICDKPVTERFQITKQVSSITHGHIRSVIACFYYLEFAKHLIEGKTKFEAYAMLQKEIPSFLNGLSVEPTEQKLYSRLLNQNISNEAEDRIFSTGYVLYTLEASIWCLLTTNNYSDAVLKAVNLGSDTDTTATVTGGLAGILYGYENIPNNWLEQIVRLNDIRDLADRLETVYS